MIRLEITEAEFRALVQLLETGAKALQAGRRDPFLELALESLNERLAKAQETKSS